MASPQERSQHSQQRAADVDQQHVTLVHAVELGYQVDHVDAKHQHGQAHAMRDRVAPSHGRRHIPACDRGQKVVRQAADEVRRIGPIGVRIQEMRAGPAAQRTDSDVHNVPRENR